MLPAPTISLLQPGTIALILFAAVGYSVATIGMKMGATALSWGAIAVVLLGLAAAIFGEVTVLRHVNLGPIYIAILGVESLIVLFYAWYIGEGMSPRQLGGASLVLAGMLMVNA
ncbi:5-aminolevulinate synthase [Pseudorhodobacter sp. E13]|nr:5-aminolevulinate synthase [Pseudorhodobacter sp. E13]